METYDWNVLVTFHRDVVGCFTWDVPATSLGRTEREKSLLRLHDVLMSGGWLVRQLRQFFEDANCLLLSFFFSWNYRFCQKYGNVTNSRGWGESYCNTTWKSIHDSPLSCIKLRVAICILVCIMWVIRKIDCFIRKCSILVKIRGSMFCVTNRCRKVIAN